jgi:hypothetical protein
MARELSSIDDVLVSLDEIIERCKQQNDTRALFAYVYRRTTAHIKQGVEEGLFEDNERMNRFDVAFARRYIDAYWQYENGTPPTQSWFVPFECRKKKISVVQHVLMGMNAHINLDLGIVAAEMEPGDRIYSLENDFMTINRLLSELIDEFQQSLGKVSPALFLLDFVGGRGDEWLVGAGINRIRTVAWDFAVELAHLSEAERKKVIATKDWEVAHLGSTISDPKVLLLGLSLRIIRLFEKKEVATILQRMQ